MGLSVEQNRMDPSNLVQFQEQSLALQVDRGTAEASRHAKPARVCAVPTELEG